MRGVSRYDAGRDYLKVMLLSQRTELGDVSVSWDAKSYFVDLLKLRMTAQKASCTLVWKSWKKE